jgi:hypothetical protein
MPGQPCSAAYSTPDCPRWLLLAALLCAAGFAGSCGWQEQWRERRLQNYHASRWQVILHGSLDGAAGLEFPTRPGVPQECQAEVEPAFLAIRAAQIAEQEQWQALLAASEPSVGAVTSMAAALAARDGTELAKLSAELRAAIEASETALRQWQAADAALSGAFQQLEVAYLKALPAEAPSFDFDADLAALRKSRFNAQIEALAKQRLAAEGTPPGQRKEALEHAKQESLNGLVKEYQDYHAAAYGRLASAYLDAAIEQDSAAVPAPAALEDVNTVLRGLEPALAARYDLDELTARELERFELASGLRLEDVLALPAAAPSDPVLAAENRGQQVEASAAGLDRQQLWQKLKQGIVPSLSGKRDKVLKDYRKEMLAISLARLQLLRELNELLSRSLSVQQRELTRQWEAAWPNPAVETNLFAFAEARKSVRQSTRPVEQLEELP